MKSKEQVRLEMIGLNLSALSCKMREQLSTGKLTAKQHGDLTTRLDKAGKIATYHERLRSVNGGYLVTSEKSPAVVYTVTPNTCTCPDFEQAPVNYCKHRMAVWLHQETCKTLKHLQARTHGLPIPHDHTYRCGHGPDTVQCWDKDCTDIVAPLCKGCAHPTPEGDPDVTPHATTPLGDCTNTCLPCQTEATEAEAQNLLAQDWHPHTCPSCLCILLADVPHTCDPIVTEQYEPAPVLTPKVYPLPEAPASLNLKIKLRDGHELMYTLRGHDDSIIDRLPTIFAKLEAAVQPQATDPEHSWLWRIAQGFLPLSWRKKTFTTDNGHGSEQ